MVFTAESGDGVGAEHKSGSKVLRAYVIAGQSSVTSLATTVNHLFKILLLSVSAGSSASATGVYGPPCLN